MFDDKVVSESIANLLNAVGVHGSRLLIIPNKLKSSMKTSKAQEQI
jgi:hypothetical protein